MDAIPNLSERKERREPTRDPELAPVSTITCNPEQQLVSLLACESFEANKYRILMHRIEETRVNCGRGVIVVTSPGADEGKTTTAINLAGTLAQSKGSRVLLVYA